MNTTSWRYRGEWRYRSTCS